MFFTYSYLTKSTFILMILELRTLEKKELGHNFCYSRLTLAERSFICQLQRPGAQLIASNIGSPEWCLTDLALSPIQRSPQIAAFIGVPPVSEEIWAGREDLSSSQQGLPEYHAPRIFGIVELFHHLTSWVNQ